jgi:hypothetical protein
MHGPWIDQFVGKDGQVHRLDARFLMCESCQYVEKKSVLMTIGGGWVIS